jgi:hypothetical protein
MLTFESEKASHIRFLQEQLKKLEEKVTDISQLTAWRVETVTEFADDICESAQPQQLGQVYLSPAYRALISATQLENYKYQLADQLKAARNDTLQALARSEEQANARLAEKRAETAALEDYLKR